MKKATTVEEQIEKIKSRGMLFNLSEDKVKEVLSDIGYFRLGFYCFPFETTYPQIRNRTHKFKEGSKISDVVDLYYLDVDLRNILSKYINRIEINFRTNIVYTVSNQYIDDNTWFMNNEVMEKRFIDAFDYKLYTDIFKKKPVIKNHHDKYINDNYAPAWKTLEFFTFSSILKIYKNLKSSVLKQKIATQYKIRNEEVLQNYFDSLVEIRNICAHGGVLFDHTLSRSLGGGPALKITNNNKNKLYSVMQVMEYILSNISQNRADEMKEEFKTFFEKFKDNPKIRCIIENCLGYQNF